MSLSVCTESFGIFCFTTIQSTGAIHHRKQRKSIFSKDKGKEEGKQGPPKRQEKDKFVRLLSLSLVCLAKSRRRELVEVYVYTLLSRSFSDP